MPRQRGVRVDLPSHVEELRYAARSETDREPPALDAESLRIDGIGKEDSGGRACSTKGAPHRAVEIVELKPDVDRRRSGADHLEHLSERLGSPGQRHFQNALSLSIQTDAAPPLVAGGSGEADKDLGMHRHSSSSEAPIALREGNENS
jgi:hypothetical protein